MVTMNAVNFEVFQVCFLPLYTIQEPHARSENSSGLQRIADSRKRTANYCRTTKSTADRVSCAPTSSTSISVSDGDTTSTYGSTIHQWLRSNTSTVFWI